MAASKEIQDLAAVVKATGVLHKRSADTILDRLFEHLLSSDTENYVSTIAEKVLKTDGDQKGLDAARNAIARLRRALNNFYRTIGKRNRRRLNIPEGIPYRLQATSNDLPVDWAEEFWYPYIDAESNVLVWAEPLVFYDASIRGFIRFLDVNADDLVTAAKLEKKLPSEYRGRQLVPSFGYQSSGDIAAVHGFQNWLGAKGVTLLPLVSRDTTEKAVLHKNAIIIGNKRTNTYVKTLQEGLDFAVDRTRVIISEPDDSRNEKAKYDDFVPTRVARSAKPDFAYALVTRRPNIRKSATATVISANHGRAIERVSQFLMDKDSMSALFKSRMSPEDEAWPQCFQVVFEIEVHQYDQVYQEAVPIAFRAYPPLARTETGGQPGGVKAGGVADS